MPLEFVLFFCNWENFVLQKGVTERGRMRGHREITGIFFGSNLYTYLLLFYIVFLLIFIFYLFFFYLQITTRQFLSH